MARYFFDITDNDNLIRDTEGTELDGAQAARVEAIAVLPELVKGLEADGDHHTLTVTVRDVVGRPVFQANLVLDCAWMD